MLVDDQATGAAHAAHHRPDVEVVGEAESGEATLRLVRSESPDVILMDAEMPGMGGITATAALRTTAPHVAVFQRQRGGGRLAGA